jgi:hypothetical protein
MANEDEIPRLLCDLCGCNDWLPETDTSIRCMRLCPQCVSKLEAAPEKLKQTVEKYLAGNLL